MPPRSGLRAPIQLLVEGRDAQFFFMAFLNQMGFNNVEVQSDVEWRGHSRVYREASDLIVGLGLTDSLDERDVVGFDRVRSAILERLDPSEVEISSFGGVTELRGFLSAVWNAPNARTTIEAIGIVRDAESDADAAFESARAAISAIGLIPPDGPLQVVDQKPRIGVLILPPGQSAGMLEDVCLDAVHEDPAMLCVEEYLACVQKRVTDWPNINRSKAKVQAFLASRDEPGLLLGQAAERGDWDWSKRTFWQIKHFVQELTNDTA